MIDFVVGVCVAVVGCLMCTVCLTITVLRGNQSYEILVGMQCINTYLYSVYIFLAPQETMLACIIQFFLYINTLLAIRQYAHIVNSYTMSRSAIIIASIAGYLVIGGSTFSVGSTSGVNNTGSALSLWLYIWCALYIVCAATCYIATYVHYSKHKSNAVLRYNEEAEILPGQEGSQPSHFAVKIYISTLGPFLLLISIIPDIPLYAGEIGTGSFLLLMLGSYCHSGALYITSTKTTTAPPTPLRPYVPPPLSIPPVHPSPSAPKGHESTRSPKHCNRTPRTGRSSSNNFLTVPGVAPQTDSPPQVVATLNITPALVED